MVDGIDRRALIVVEHHEGTRLHGVGESFTYALVLLQERICFAVQRMFVVVFIEQFSF